jgi:hypothetical protein
MTRIQCIDVISHFLLGLLAIISTKTIVHKRQLLSLQHDLQLNVHSTNNSAGSPGSISFYTAGASELASGSSLS